MLVLTREIGQSITIADNIVVTVVSITNGKCRLGFVCPEEVRIVRDDAKKKKPDLLSDDEEIPW